MEIKIVHPGHGRRDVRHHIMTFDEIDEVAKSMDNSEYLKPDNDEQRWSEWFLSEMDSSVREELEFYGFVFSPNGVDFRTFDNPTAKDFKDVFKSINCIFAFIDAAYNADTPNTRGGWGPMLDFMGSDDSVDYNSSMPSMVVEAVEEALLRHYKKEFGL